MKKVKALLSLALVGSMLLPYSTAFAAEVTTPGGSADSEVTLTVGDTAPKIFSVTVPSEIPINITKDGEIQVAKNLNIRNDSSDAVEVTAIKVTGKNDWSVVDYSDDFVSKPDNSKVLALSFRGDATDSSGNITLTPENWAIAASQELDIRAEAKLSRQTNSSSKSNIATVNWSFNWADATTEPGPPDTSSINHNWDPSTIMVIGSAKDVVFDWSSTMDVNNISTVESSNPDVATIELSPVQMFSEGTGTYTVTGKAVGKTTIRATLTSGESTSFEVTVNDVRPGTGGDGDDIEITIPGEDLNPGDKIDPDIEIEIPVTTPDGDGTITVKPEVPDTELKPGNNEIPAEVDINGIKITIIIKVTVSGGTSNPSDGLHQSIEEAQAMGFTFSSYGDGLQIDSFENKQFREEINVPEQIGDFEVLKIGDRVFKGQTNLTEITLPSTITAIGESAFYRCSGLKSLTLPESIVSIGQNAFTNAGDTESTITVRCNTLGFSGGYGTADKGTFYDSGFSNIVLENNITEIKSSAFVSSDVVSIVIPESVESIGSSAFEGCRKLTSIELGSNITSLGYSVFEECTSLQSVKLNANITSIPGSTFYKCSSLSNVEIGSPITEIGESAFRDCTSLTKFDVPSGVTTIGLRAFAMDVNLTDVTLPSSLTKIDREAFSNCYGIADLTVPSNVTTIYNNAFQYVKHVTYSGSASGSPWGAKSVN